MGNINKVFSFLLVVFLAVSSLLIVESVTAQSIPQSPIFTLKVVEHSYDLPPVYKIDQFTGKNITVTEGAHYQWRTLDFTISNQPVPSGSSLYFNIRYKGQYASDWTNVYYEGRYVAAQSGQYSTIPFLISGQMPTSQGDLYHLIIPAGTTVDFQVEALIGSITRGSPQFGSGDVFSGEASSWSNARTIIIPEAASASASPNPTQTQIETANPTENNSTGNGINLTITTLALIIIITVLATSITSVLIFKRHQKMTK
jgi:hypothetical protein